MFSQVTLLIYAGGRATRMGGVNKALVLYRGRPMVEWVKERLAPSVACVLLSANRDRPIFEAMGFTVCEDTFPDHPGPLAALLAVGESGLVPTPWVLTAPCDAPEVPTDLAAILWRAAEQDNFEANAYSIVAEGHVQNAFALIRAKELPCVRPFLESGERKLGFWLKSIVEKKVFVENYDGNFSNINGYKELYELEQKKKTKSFQKTP